jgi:hypothetical protein
MTTTCTRPRSRVLSVWAAGVVLVVAMLGHVVLSAPQASASCTLTAQDDQYIHLLAMKNMIHSPDYTDCHMAAEGRWFAYQVRNSADPLGTARSLVQMVIDGTPMSADQAEWEVESAIYVYAPEVIPKIKDQLAQQNPA